MIYSDITSSGEVIFPVIADADALYAVAQDKSVLCECTCDLIFTPHAMEMSRLTGLDISYIEENRLEVSKEFSEETGAVLLLKGHHSIVTAPSLTQYINSTGNPGMASGGSGDVLAGIITALIGQGIAPLEAAACGAWLHGKAGDLCARELGQYGMLPTDMLQVLPRLLK